MTRYKLVAAVLFPALLMTGCKTDEGVQRSTSNSANLTGLWRMNLKSAQSNLKADSNISFTVVETASGLTMTGCDGRSVAKLQKQNGKIEGLPAGTVAIVNNDTMTSSSDMGVATATKMALASKFDMGKLQLTAPQLGTVNFTDLCVISTDARVLGVVTQDNISGTTVYKGKPLLFDILVIGNLKLGTYNLAREPQVGQATLRLQSEGFKAGLNRTEMTLDEGKLTITEDSTVWMKGNFSATMPNGSALTGNFEFEKP